MFLLVSVRHVGAHPDELQHGVSIQSSINLGKTFPRISRIRIIPSTQILARVFVYLPPLISQILDFICRMVLIFISIYFEWRDTENQQLVKLATSGLSSMWRSDWLSYYYAICYSPLVAKNAGFLAAKKELKSCFKLFCLDIFDQLVGLY